MTGFFKKLNIRHNFFLLDKVRNERIKAEEEDIEDDEDEEEEKENEEKDGKEEDDKHEIDDGKQTKSQFEKDKDIFQKTLQRLSHWGDRSTFHGIDVLMETPPDWKRVFVIAFLLGMSWTCWGCLAVLIVGFLKLPISTVINNGQATFHFPTITLCPDSPFSMQQLQEGASQHYATYKEMANFWVENAYQSSQKNVTVWSQFEAEWRLRTKRSFLAHYINASSNLSIPWDTYFVACQYNGYECGLLGVKSIPAPVNSGEVGKSNNAWLLDPGTIYGYRDDGIFSQSRSGNKRTVKAVPNTENSNEWPTVRPIIISHPSKYQCFQFRVNSGDVKQPGSISGFHIILKRPYSRLTTHPALLYTEGIANIYQAWDDHAGPVNGSDAHLANSLDGFTVLVHEESRHNFDGSLPADEIFTSGSSRNVVRATVRFGEHIGIILSQFSHRRLSSFFRPCRRRIAPLYYLDLVSFYQLDKTIDKYIRVAYTRNNCISSLRQGLIYRKCGCLSEDIFVPLYLAEYLALNGFCHSTLEGGINKSVLSRSQCHDAIIKMTAKQVLLNSLPISWHHTVLVKPGIETELLWLCPQFCQETVNNIERKQVVRQIEPIIPKSDSVGIIVEPEDYLTISISAKETQTAVVSEGEQITIFNLLASIGGTFGLFLGLSGVTAFEVIEAWVIVFRGGFGLLRYGFFLIKQYFIKMAHFFD